MVNNGPQEKGGSSLLSPVRPVVQAFDWARAAKWGLCGAVGTAAVIAGAPLMAGAAVAGGLCMGTIAALSTVGGMLVGGMAGHETLTITTNGRYGILPANPSVLYSVDGAPAPTPRGLYIKGQRQLGGTEYTTW